MKDLAPNNRPFNLALPFLFSGLLIILTLASFNSEVQIETFYFLLASALLLGLWIYFAARNKNVFYDDEALYLKSGRKVEKIPLKNVSRLKLTLSSMKIMGILLLQYKIEYRDNSGKSSKVTFWDTGSHEKYDDFERTVKKVNPEFKAEHWAHTLE